MAIELRLSAGSSWSWLDGKSGPVADDVLVTDREGEEVRPTLLLHRPARAEAPQEVGFFVAPDRRLVEISPGESTPRDVIALAWEVAQACGLEAIRLAPGEDSLLRHPALAGGNDPDARLEILRGIVLERGLTSEPEFRELLAARMTDAHQDLDGPSRESRLEAAREELGLKHLPAPLRRELTAGARAGAGDVELRHEGSLSRIRIVRPQVLNALDPELLARLDTAWQEAEARPATTAILLEASGPAFMAGVDLARILTWIESDRLDCIEGFVRDAHRFLARVDACRCHTLVAVQGLAVGAGAEFCAAFDSVLASTQASIGFPELRLGIYPAMGGTQRLPRRIGLPAARWWILGSRRLHAQHARRLGLVDLVTDPRDLETATISAAAGPPLGSRAASRTVAAAHPGAPDVTAPDTRAADLTVSLLEHSARSQLGTGLDHEIRNLGEVYGTGAAFEGIRRAVHGPRRSRPR